MGRFRSSVGSRPGVAVLASLATLAVVGGATVVRAAIPDTSGVIHACYKTTSGALIVINTAKTASCPSGNKPLSWPAYTGLTGIQEFTSSGTWTPPEGVTHVMAEVWGGGGGGGDAAPSNACRDDAGDTGNGGGGGGAGAYIRAVTPVVQGQLYTVTVGAAGTYNSGSSGGNGGNSTVSLGSSILLSAGGGGGGGFSDSAGQGGTLGTAGVASITTGSGLIRLGSSATPGCNAATVSGQAGVALSESVAGAGHAGSGGTSDFCGAGGCNGAGRPGYAGYVLLTW